LRIPEKIPLLPPFSKGDNEGNCKLFCVPRTKSLRISIFPLNGRSDLRTSRVQADTEMGPTCPFGIKRSMRCERILGRGPESIRG
jgi:hypothetical protein